MKGAFELGHLKYAGRNTLIVPIARSMPFLLRARVFFTSQHSSMKILNFFLFFVGIKIALDGYMTSPLDLDLDLDLARARRSSKRPARNDFFRLEIKSRRDQTDSLEKGFNFN